AHRTRWHQEAKCKLLSKSLVRRLSPRKAEVVDSRLVTVNDQMAILMDHRRTPLLGRMVSVDEDAATQIRRICIHSCDVRWQRPIEDAQADIPFQQTAKIVDWLVSKP